MKQIISSMLLLLALSACGGDAKEILGLNRESPDEFVVVSRPSLSIPPEFNLVPPEPGKDGPRQSTSDQARSALLGDTPSDSLTSEFALDGITPAAPNTAVMPVLSSTLGNAASSAGDSAFLSRAGADAADSDIRTKLGVDERVEKPQREEAKSLYEDITQSDKAEPVVDAKKEAKRLRKNKDSGKAINEGKVPTIKPQSGNVLDRIF